MTNTIFQVGLNKEIWDIGDLVLNGRFLDSLQSGVARYPIYREFSLAARMELQPLFDAISLQPGWMVQRFNSRTIMLDSPDAFVVVRGARKADYCSCYFAVWSGSVERATQVHERILEIVGDALVTEPMFSIDWHFLTSKRELENVAIEEFADDQLFDEGYPDIEGGVDSFIARFLSSTETVLVIQGPPGTGKTRLIRAILGALSRRKGGNASALYTGDKKALENDEIFVRFITGWEDAFVVEDADHLLKPRAEGNENLHRFLAIADGVVRAQGRKIIFSTNLPNIHDIDDALIRPGRCFARVGTRELSGSETQCFIQAICDGDSDKAMQASSLIEEEGKKTFSLAEIYKAVGENGA